MTENKKLKLNSRLNGLLNAFNKVETISLVLSGSFIAMIAVLTIIDVTGRFAFNNPLKGNIELQELAMVAIIWLAIAGAEKMDAHVSMELILNKLIAIKSRFYSYLKILTLSISIALFGILSYYGIRYVLSSIAISETSGGPLYVIVWPLKIILTIGIIELTIRLIINLIHVLHPIGET
ncbi:MAG: TRAP transporter small permease [Dehalococcoidales bacterium]|nr:TRAP transporter small permease [Dehalococcoidales bacterium]